MDQVTSDEGAAGRSPNRPRNPLGLAAALRHDGLVQTVIVWMAVGMVLTLLWQPLVSLLSPILVLPLWAGYGLVGAGIGVAMLVRLVRPASRRGALATLAMAVTFLVAMWFGGWWWIARAGDTLEFRLRFMRVEPRYAAMLPEILEAPAAGSEYQRRDGVRFLVDSGPPRRVAFVQSGFLDNWEGIVYDPSGAVAQARGWNFDGGGQEFTAPPEVRALFGGDIVRCEHVRNFWYRCWFT